MRTTARCTRAVLAAAILIAAGRRASAQTKPCGIPGKDGPGGVLSGVVNTYYPGATANLAVNATSVSLGASSGAGAGITPGDLVLIIQIQDATIRTNNNSSYGANNGTGSGATNWNTSGNYEYVVATNTVGTGGGTLTFRGGGSTGGLVNAYAAANYSGAAGQKRYEAIRVPQYSSATFGSGLTALAWDGNVGGVLAVDVAGTLTLGGTVSVSGKGFRGGGGRQLAGGSGTSTDYRTLSTNNANASKGEGVAGTPRYVYDGVSLVNTTVEGYASGSYARGAPGNAGGGGTDADPAANDQNTGGGGGGNAGAGGTGGNSWSSNLAVGGKGGAATPASANRIFMGGGGGAGTTNNGTGSGGAGLASSGAAGGGIVIVRAGVVSGSGAIDADGLSASSTVQNDGSGGGGAGGTVIVYAASGSLAGLSVSAQGGDGGSNSGGGANHGPGGGGGGGLVAVNGAASISVSGGASGTTADGTAYGSTSGSSGIAITSLATASIDGANVPSACVPQLTATKVAVAPTTVAAGGTATYTITVSNASGRDTARSLNIIDSLPAGMKFAAVSSFTTSGGTTATGSLTPTAGDSIVVDGTLSIPGGGSASLTFTVSISGRATPGTRDNSAWANYLDPARTVITATTSAGYLGSSSTGENVTITGVPDLTITKTHSGTFIAGKTGSWTLTVTNSGTAASGAAPVTSVKDTLPAGLTYNAASGTGWTCAAAGQVVTCTRGVALAVGASATAITVTANVTPAAVPGVTNRAWVSGSTEPAVNADNNSATDATSVASVAVAVTPDAATTTKLPSNGTTYSQTFAVANNGSASDVFTLLASVAPAGRTTVVSVNGVAGATTTLTIGAGATTNVNVVYQVADTATAGVVDTVRLRATSQTDASTTDPGDLRVTVIRAGLSMTKTLYRDDRTTVIGPTDSAAPGEYVQYKVTVTGSGAADATTVHVVDTLPSEVQYDSAGGDTTGWTFGVSGQTITADLAGTLSTGASRYFWLRVKLK